MWELLIPTFAKLIDKVLPDPAAAAAAKLKMLELQQTGDLAELKAQADSAQDQLKIDLAEAQSNDPLQHWRGALGWVCVTAYAWNFVVLPMAAFAATLAGYAVKLPGIDGQPLYTLTTCMLGLGTMHVYQSVKTAK